MDGLFNFSFNSTKSKRSDSKTCYFKNGHYTIVENQNFVDMFRECSNPSFQRFSCQSCQYDILHYCETEKQKMISYY